MAIVLFVVTLVAFYFAWPVSLWVVIGALAMLAMDQWVKREERDGTEFRKAVSLELKDACRWVTVGLGAVAVAQILFELFGSVISDAHVLWAETHASELHDRLHRVLSLKVQAIVWGSLVCLSLVTGTRAVRRYAALRKYVTKAMIVLSVASSFTFFSLKAVGNGEPRWIAKWTDRAQVRTELDHIEQSRKKLVALAWIADQIKGPTGGGPGSPPDVFRELLTGVRSQGDARENGALLARSVPTLNLGEQNPQPNVLRDWLDAKQDQASWLDAKPEQLPTLKQVADLTSEDTQITGKVKQAEAAILELLKDAIGEVVGPHLENSIIESFVEAFTDSVVQEKMQGFVSKVLSDAMERRSWQSATPRADVAIMPTEWALPADYGPVQERGCTVKFITEHKLKGVVVSTETKIAKAYGSICQSQPSVDRFISSEQ